MTPIRTSPGSPKKRGSELLLIPQFTLAADTKAAAAEKGARSFDRPVELCLLRLAKVEYGRFGAKMQVSLTKRWPVTFWLESRFLAGL